jgi:hypothetical protein
LSLDDLAKEYMLNLGIAGTLIDILKSNPVGVENHYANQLSSLLRYYLPVVYLYSEHALYFHNRNS